MNKVPKWSLKKLTSSEDQDGALYILVSNDHTNGLMLELDDIQTVINHLQHFLTTGEHDGEINETDPRIPWITSADAIERWGVAPSSITWACRRGLIRGAKKGPRGWTFPKHTFLAWLKQRPGRGGRHKGN